MKDELKALFGREVDIADKEALKNSLPTARNSTYTSGDLCPQIIVMLDQIWDMVRAIHLIQEFTADLTYYAYLDSVLTQSAVERQLEIYR